MDILTVHVHSRHRAHRLRAGAGCLGPRAAVGRRGRGRRRQQDAGRADLRAGVCGELCRQARRAGRRGPRAGDARAGGDLRAGRARGDLRGAALLDRHRQSGQRGAAAEGAGARDGDRDDAAVLRAGMGRATAGARRGAARRPGARLLPSPLAQRAPLPRAPAHRTGGEDPLREVADRRKCVDAAVRGADLGDRGGAAEQGQSADGHRWPGTRGRDERRR